MILPVNVYFQFSAKTTKITCIIGWLPIKYYALSVRSKNESL